MHAILRSCANFHFFLSRVGLPQSVSILQEEIVKHTKEIDIRRFFGHFDFKLISKRHVDFKIHSADRDGSFDTHNAIFHVIYVT